MQKPKSFVAIVLAAGVGKRMKSKTPKVLHKIGSKPMITKTVGILGAVNPTQIIIVASPRNINLLKRELGDDLNYAIQKHPLGTGDATKVGLETVNPKIETVAVMYGDDTAFYKPQTIKKVFRQHQRSDAKVSFVTVKKNNPSGLGRIVRKEGKLVAIIEEKDATPVQKKIKEINDGLYFFERSWLVANISKLSPSPITGEFYLTDLIAHALDQKQKVETFRLADDRQWHGVNTKEELQSAQEKFQKRIHIMGIAGAGASAVAALARAAGFVVSGCDLDPDSPYRKNLKGIPVKRGHHPSHLEDIVILVISPAVSKFNPNNPEISRVKRLKIPLVTWQQFQGNLLQKNKFVIAIAGAYGKSTTTAMISKVLVDQGKEPTCEIGATVLEWGTNYRVGKSKYYICEADEYNDNFLNYHPDIAVILNVAWDHPDFFRSEDSVLASYKKFIGNIREGGYLIIGDDPQLAKLAKLRKEDLKIVKVQNFGKLNLSLIGDFRQENANAALTVAKILKLDLDLAKKSVKNFTGVGRRLEYKGEIQGVKVYDDYAVQPHTALKTADALKEKFHDKKVVLVFEPHTFSRIQTFFAQFVKSLKESKVDKILITEVYAAREKGDLRSLAQRLAREIGPKAIFAGSIEETAIYLKKNLKDFGVILSMGAGKAFQLCDLLKKNG